MVNYEILIDLLAHVMCVLGTIRNDAKSIVSLFLPPSVPLFIAAPYLRQRTALGTVILI